MKAIKILLLTSGVAIGGAALAAQPPGADGSNVVVRPDS